DGTCHRTGCQPDCQTIWTVYLGCMLGLPAEARAALDDTRWPTPGRSGDQVEGVADQALAAALAGPPPLPRLHHHEAGPVEDVLQHLAGAAAHHRAEVHRAAYRRREAGRPEHGG